MSLCTDGLVWYLDESGGAHGSDILLRRIGWAVVAFQKGDPNAPENLIEVGAICGSLPGEHQTINRANVPQTSLAIGGSYLSSRELLLQTRIFPRSRNIA